TYTAVVVTDSSLIARELQKEWSARAASPAAVAAGVSAPTDAAPSTSPRPGLPAIALGLAVIIALAYAAPIMIGITSPIHLLIAGFALYEAWKLNRGVTVQVTGPYQAAARPGTSASVIYEGLRRRSTGAGAIRVRAVRHTDRARPARLPLLPTSGIRGRAQASSRHRGRRGAGWRPE